MTAIVSILSNSCSWLKLYNSWSVLRWFFIFMLSIDYCSKQCYNFLFRVNNISIVLLSFFASQR
ncbi:hypothetical protein BDC45DRAFT_504081 [Circinella umbellata]|nr:hypothetical protein BDC45DRAFT_504081 [Circinella umbellata]